MPAAEQEENCVDFDSNMTKLVEGIKLPPQPKIILAINREIQSDSASIQRIAELVSQDAALSAKVLKVVNSPLFGVRQEIDSINFAVSRMGMKNFYCVVLSSCLRDSMGIDKKTERLWQHTALVAKLCESIAKKVSGVAPEKAYMVGLFHDAAIPIIAKKYKTAYETLEKVAIQGGDINTFEEQAYGTRHAVIGYLLARSWGLPDDVAEAIQYHHTTDLSLFPDAASAQLGRILMLADHLSREAAEENEDTDFQDPVWNNIEADVLSDLGLDEDNMLDLRETAMEYSQLS